MLKVYKLFATTQLKYNSRNTTQLQVRPEIEYHKRSKDLEMF
jgi:hypothetical protein